MTEETIFEAALALCDSGRAVGVSRWGLALARIDDAEV